MSTSSITTTPNPTTTTTTPSATVRRRILDNSSTPHLNPISNAAVLSIPTQNPALLNNREALLKNPEIKISPNRKPAYSVKKASKTPKPKWLTITRSLTRNLLMLFIVGGLVQIVRKLLEKNDVVSNRDGVGFGLIAADFEGKFAEIDFLVKKTSKMIQVQVDVIDQKLENYVGSLKEEIEQRDVRIDEKLGELREGFGGRLDGFLSKEEFEGFVDGYLKGREGRGGGGFDLDDVRVYAKEVVEREIEKHAADGLGKVDFALASGGGRVLRHSEAAVDKAGGGWNSRLGRSRGSGVHPDAVKMLTPSFGEAGACFALKGSSGFVTIRLRNAVVVEAITLEHVAASVAYDRSSAPKDCRVYGWQAQAEDLVNLNTESEKMFLLSKFTYDLEKSNAQTFKVVDSVGSRVVDRIKFDFLSNYGSSFHTCVYRLRIHGHEPSPSSSAAEP